MPHPLWKGRKSVVRPHHAGGRFEMWCVQFFFVYQQKSILFYSASKVALQQQRTKWNIILILVIVNLRVVFWFLPSGGDRLAEDPAMMPTQTESTALVRTAELSGRLCCLRSGANVGATLGVRPQRCQRCDDVAWRRIASWEKTNSSTFCECCNMKSFSFHNILQDLPFHKIALVWVMVVGTGYQIGNKCLFSEITEHCSCHGSNLGDTSNAILKEKRLFLWVQIMSYDTPSLLFWYML